MSNHLKLLTLDSKLFTVLPVETVIRDCQEGYYAALSQADSAGESTPFVEFLLDALHVALNEAITLDVEQPDPATDPDTDPVQRLLHLFREKPEQGIASLMEKLGLRLTSMLPLGLSKMLQTEPTAEIVRGKPSGWSMPLPKTCLRLWPAGYASLTSSE